MPSFLSQRIWVIVREVYNRSKVLLSAFVPLYIGLGVTAPARADFSLVLNSGSSSLSFASGAFHLKPDLNKLIPQY